MKNNNILETLSSFLSVLSAASEETTILTDKEGVCILAVDSAGDEISELKGKHYAIAKESMVQHKAIYSESVMEKDMGTWCIPMGNYIICSNTAGLIRENELLKKSLINALPFIARVAGGEAVVFDKDGTRVATVDMNGKTDESFIGKISKHAAKAMKTQKPVIGESNYVNGANAVRIPINKEFGFGFNNEKDVLRKQKLIDEIKKNQSARYNFEDIIGKSDKIKEAKETAKLASDSISNVLIYGDTGTGKEVFAQSIHNASKRANKPFIAVNCAAIPHNLMESSFFGYESGAFTGAKKEGSKGFFEQAKGGTIFLDEISEMDLDLQSKVLRVLQEKKITRVGGNKEIDLDFRVIFATNKRLEEMVKKNEFREDLYYRINVLDINLPSLKDIREDIPLLINNAIKKMNNMFGLFVEGIDEEALDLMIKYDWPGNVRELMNYIERSFNVIGKEKIIKVKHLPIKIKELAMEDKKSKTGLNKLLQEYEKEIIVDALNINKGVKIDTAEYLDISTTTLWRKMNLYEID